MAMLEKEKWVIWFSFLCLSSLFILIGITWKSRIHSPSEREQGYAGPELWIFIKLSKLLTSLKGRSLMSIMLINLFIFFYNWTAFKSVDIGYCSQNTTSLWLQHSCSAPHCLVTDKTGLSTPRLTPGPATLPLLSSKGILITTCDILNQFVFF